MIGSAASEAAITIALVGAGNRGGVYANYLLKNPGRGSLVAAAEPNPARLFALAVRHGLKRYLYPDWRELLRERLADAVVIAAPDKLHLEPALRALELGYHVLLEKPIATTRDEVLELARAARGAQGSVTIAHVLRYTPFFRQLKALVDEGRIGRLMSIDHLENIGYWHFAHSFVRGNWRRLEASSPMILAKACHDLDLLRWLAGVPCRKLSSFGGLSYFRPENAPQGAAKRCLDCPVERRCPYSAVRFYLETHGETHGWPVSVITHDTGMEGRLKALHEGPYGRCVYFSDNDVADHQVVALEFEGGVTATLTVSAFTLENTRTVKLMGSQGEIRGHLDRGEIEVRSFLGDKYERLQVPGGVGHAGGDDGLMDAFLNRLERLKAGRETPETLTSLEESLESHLMAFAAEEARLSGAVVTLGRP